MIAIMNKSELTLWFGLTPSERRGSFVFVLIIIAIGMMNLILDGYHNPEVKLSERDLTVVDSILIAYEANKKKHTNDGYVRSQEKKRTLTPTQYDPNTVSYQELIAMGVPKRTATIWVNYRKKGGKFSKPPDIQGIYTLENEVLQALPVSYTHLTLPTKA